MPYRAESPRKAETAATKRISTVSTTYVAGGEALPILNSVAQPPAEQRRPDSTAGTGTATCRLAWLQYTTVEPLLACQCR